MKIAVLVSGGVDSSVALNLLKEQGHDLTAFYLKIWLEDELSHLGDCPWQEDLAYVEKVCQQAGVPLKVISLQKEYHQEVVGYTIDQVRRGFTPNPDVLCNRRVKFGAFFDHIDASYDKVATGHYAQIKDVGGKAVLMQAPDPVKDQTYFLSHMTQEQLGRALFPIGHLTKNEVRQLAQKYDLPNKDRKDSQGICFLGKIKFNEFLRHHLGTKHGDLIEIETNKVIGQHDGFWYHTIGQRKGLGLSGGPWFVVDKDPTNNIVYISKNYYSADKKRNSFVVGQCNWIAGSQPSKANLRVKLRHGEHFHDAHLEQRSAGSFAVTIDKDDQGLAPGQFAAFYDGSTCLGSCVIQNG